MSDLFTAVAERLRAQCPTAADVIAATSAAEAEGLALGPAPILLVVPAAERWLPVREAGLMVSQAGEITVSVITALAGFNAGAAWTEARREIRAALLGWVPQADEIVGALEARGARLLTYSPAEGGQWLHAFDFACAAQTHFALQS